MNPFLTRIRTDLPASVFVFLVALPLCLGIALGSEAPLFSGLIAGIAGGIIVGWISKSSLSVSGPAAGLTTIVAGSIAELPAFEAFLLAVVLAGVIQILLGLLKAGLLGDFIPVAVIRGMLAAIGLTLVLKQIPHLVGYDHDFEGDERFLQADGENTFTEIVRAIENITPGACMV
ncbi:MAG: SulP family inorganic anion transporter, partial [Bacteroidota bacterium]